MTFMDIVTTFIWYSLVFHIAIVLVGLTSLYCGYRLFYLVGDKESHSAVNISLSGASFALRNAAPGTCFAVFGAIIIITMILKGSPELMLSGLKSKFVLPNSDFPAPETIDKLSMKGEGQSRFDAIILHATIMERDHKYEAAIRDYEQGLALIAAPMNSLASLYLKKNDDSSIALARLAVEISPKEALFRETLKEVSSKYPRGVNQMSSPNQDGSTENVK